MDSGYFLGYVAKEISLGYLLKKDGRSCLSSKDGFQGSATSFIIEVSTEIGNAQNRLN